MLKAPRNSFDITEKQHKYLSLYARGYTVKEISALENKSVRSVGNQITKAKDKLSAHSCVEAMFLMGWINIPPFVIDDEVTKTKKVTNRYWRPD